MSKTLQTTWAIGCMKTFLMVFNIVFWVSGLVIMCCGIWMQVELHHYLELNDDYSVWAPYAMVALGVFVLLVGALACCCTVNGHPTLLYAYGGFLVLAFLLEIVLAPSIYAYREGLAHGFEGGLNRSLKEYGMDVVRTADFDVMQARLACCGSHGYADWDTLDPPQPVPRSCCIVLAACDVENPEDIYNMGCYEKVVQYVSANMTMIGASALIVSFFPIVGFALAFCLARNIGKSKYEQIS